MVRPFGHQAGHNGQVDLLVIKRDHPAPLGQGSQFGLDQGRAGEDLGGHRAGSVIGALGQNGQRQTEGARCFAGHAGQLTGADEADVVGTQVANLSACSEPDTTGTLGEETENPCQSPFGSAQ